MPVIKDALWKNPGNPGMIVITSHGTVDEAGNLYMGYGEGAEAARRIPGIEAECGSLLAAQSGEGVYGFLPVRPSRPAERLIGFGLFQTRAAWKDQPDLEIIRYSMDSLRQYLQENPDIRVRMNFPGVGEEGLAPEEITPVLLPLPENVTVYHQGQVRRSVPDTFMGFKAIYTEVENMLRDGRSNQAVEYLVESGFDLQSAMEQVTAVQRVIRERAGRGKAAYSQF